MDSSDIIYFIISIEGLFFGSCFLILIYLVFRRIDMKKKEDFEERDN